MARARGLQILIALSDASGQFRPGLNPPSRLAAASGISTQQPLAYNGWQRNSKLVGVVATDHLGEIFDVVADRAD